LKRVVPGVERGTGPERRSTSVATLPHDIGAEGLFLQLVTRFFDWKGAEPSLFRDGVELALREPVDENGFVSAVVERV